MPRVTLKKKEYMIADLPGWIAGRMHRKKLRQEDVAKTIGIKQPSFSERLSKGGDVFSYGDLLTLFEELDATDEEILRLMRL